MLLHSPLFYNILNLVRILLFLSSLCLCILCECFDAQADFSVCFIKINDFSFDFLSDALIHSAGFLNIESLEIWGNVK